MRRSLGFAFVASFGVYLTPLVGPHAIEFLGPALVSQLTRGGVEPAWIAANVGVALAAQALLGLAIAWALRRTWRRWATIPLTLFAVVFTLPPLYILVIPAHFLIERDVASERQDWAERCVVPDAWLVPIRTPVTATAPQAWLASRASGRYAIVRVRTCDAIDARVPQPGPGRNGGVNFMLTPAFAAPRGGTMFERVETATGARSWWRLTADGERFDPLPIESQALLTVLANDGSAVGWLEQLRDAEVPVYRLHVRSMDPVYERIIRVPVPAVSAAPVELDTAARVVALWADDRIVSLDFDGAVIGESPSTRDAVRAQLGTYVRGAGGWLAWDAYREEGRYALAWSLAPGTGRHEERKGRSITSAALDPAGRYVAVSATTALSIGHARDTVYVLRTDTGAEVYRRYLPTYTRATVAFLDGGFFAYSDAAGTHLLILPK
jgi:hypothetical protein